MKRAKSASGQGNLARRDTLKSLYAKSIKVLQISTIGGGHYPWLAMEIGTESNLDGTQGNKR
jgi:hypothetical protein